MGEKPTVATLRPDDDRIDAAVALLEELGVEPLPDPMLSVSSTGERPREDADYTVLTSATAADLLGATDYQPSGALCAIGESTADALEAAGFVVDVVPDEFTSGGVVDRLAGEVDGARVEVARSDHGSAVLLDGLESAGAYVHETVLYRLVRPAEAGDSAERAAEGTLDAILFTSSLTVEHFLGAASERGVEAAARAGLDDAVVGAIGEPTRETAHEHGIDVDVVPASVGFEELARAVVRGL